MPLSPIVLFVYNRPWHTRQAVAALQHNDLARDSNLFIFADGPKNPAEARSVTEVREYLREISGFKSVTITAREDNLGLANAIIAGVTAVCQEYGRVIVVEDDLVTSPYFLRFMNQALDLYEEENQVISIHGYIYPVRAQLPETFFLRGADCWGWGTWKRGWDLFEADGGKLLAEIRQRKLAQKFDLDGAYPYTAMLAQWVAGENQSWAIRWHASAFLKDRLTLYPGRSLVRNIGHDASGVHCRASFNFSSELADVPIQVEKISAQENLFAKRQIEVFLTSLRPKIFPRLVKKCLTLVSR